MIKLVVFDFDSTLMDGETIDILSKECGFEKEVSEITEKAMAGELDFFESLKERVRYLKGMDLNKVNHICSQLPYMEGARETIRELKKREITTVVFSGGFRNATATAKDRLGLHADFSNTLHHKDGILTGEVGGEMMFDFSKGDMLARLRALMDIPQESIVAVGDGANDRSMFQYAGLKIAFNAKPILKAAADICIDQKDLTEILQHI